MLGVVAAFPRNASAQEAPNFPFPGPANFEQLATNPPPSPAPLLSAIGDAPNPARIISDGQTVFAADQVVVKFKPNVSEFAIFSFLQQNGLVQRSHIRSIGWRLLSIPGPLDASWWVAFLNTSPLVERAEVNGIITTGSVPNDEKYNQFQWNLRQIGMEAAWDRTRGGTYATAVIDTGISTYHTDLVPNIMRYDNGSLMGEDYTNTYNPSGYLAEDDGLEGNSPNQMIGHGSFVSGIIGAATVFPPSSGYVGSGIASVNPYGKILPLKTLGYNGNDPEGPYYTSPYTQGTNFNFAKAIDYAASLAQTRSVRIINASVQGYPAFQRDGSIHEPNVQTAPGYAQALLDAITRANNADVLLVTIMGNVDFGNSSDSINKFTYPAAYWNAMAIGSSDAIDQVSNFSRRGSHVSVLAPGNGIYSTFRTNPYWGGGSGTSFAAPHVAGVAGLLKEEFPSMTWKDLQYRIEDSSDFLYGQSGFDTDNGWGRINADKATQITTASHSFPETLNNPQSQPTKQIFISIPAWPYGLLAADNLYNRGDDVARMFPGANAQVSWFDPTSNQYLPYGDSRVPRFGPGKAYLVSLASASTANYNAAQPFQFYSGVQKTGHYFPVHLKPGLNGIGVPGQTNIIWNPDTFQVRTNLENPTDKRRNGMEDKRTLRAANQAGWIDLEMHYFNPATPPGGNYFPVLPVNSAMQPGSGYMIRVYRECDLLIPRPTTRETEPQQ